MRLRLDGRNAPHARERSQHRPSLRKWRLINLLPAVRKLVQESDLARGVTVEEISAQLRAKRNLVSQCFHKLNLEGVMQQGINGVPHEVRRERRNRYSGWLATIYRKC